MIKIIIAGLRNFTNYAFVEQEVVSYLRARSIKRHQVEIISGGARGVDRLGERFANSYGLKLTIFPAKWDLYGKAAGMIRNKEMADYATADSEEAILFAFWDGASRGTKNMIDIATKKEMNVLVRREDDKD